MSERLTFLSVLLSYQNLVDASSQINYTIEKLQTYLILCLILDAEKFFTKVVKQRFYSAGFIHN